MDPCAALQCGVQLAPGESVEIVAFLGQCASADEARALVERLELTDLALFTDARYARHFVQRAA